MRHFCRWLQETDLEKHHNTSTALHLCSKENSEVNNKFKKVDMKLDMKNKKLTENPISCIFSPRLSFCKDKDDHNHLTNRRNERHLCQKREKGKRDPRTFKLSDNLLTMQYRPLLLKKLGYYGMLSYKFL